MIVRWLIVLSVLVACDERAAPVDATFGMSDFKRVENCAYKLNHGLTGCVVSWNYTPFDAGSPFERVLIMHRDGSGSIDGVIDAKPHEPRQVSLGWGERVEVCGQTLKCGP